MARRGSVGIAATAATLSFIAPCSEGIIYTQLINNYIGVFDDTNSYTWEEAHHHCELFYGTSLASVHSQQDLDDCGLSRWTLSEHAWIGLSDEKIQGVWEWIDGTPYDFNVSWNPGEPNDGLSDDVHEDCVQIVATEDNRDSSTDPLANDIVCSYSYSQFICNSPIVLGYQSTAIVSDRYEEADETFFEDMESNELFIPFVVVSSLLVVIFMFGIAAGGYYLLSRRHQHKKLVQNTKKEMDGDEEQQTKHMLGSNKNGYNKAGQDDNDDLNNSHGQIDVADVDADNDRDIDHDEEE